MIIKELAILNSHLQECVEYDHMILIIEELKTYVTKTQIAATHVSATIMEKLESNCSDEDMKPTDNDQKETKKLYYYLSLYEGIIESTEKIIESAEKKKDKMKPNTSNIKPDTSNIKLDKKPYKKQYYRQLNETLNQLGEFSIDELVSELISQLGISIEPEVLVTITFHYPKENNETTKLDIFKKIMQYYSYDPSIKFKRCTKYKEYKIVVVLSSSGDTKEIKKIENFKSCLREVENHLKQEERLTPKPVLNEVVLVSNDDNCGYCRNFKPEWEKLIAEFADINFKKYDMGTTPKHEIEGTIKGNISSVPTLFANFGGVYKEIQLRDEALRDFLSNHCV
mgnify:CR=1 FL=1